MKNILKKLGVFLVLLFSEIQIQAALGTPEALEIPELRAYILNCLEDPTDIFHAALVNKSWRDEICTQGKLTKAKKLGAQLLADGKISLDATNIDLAIFLSEQSTDILVLAYLISKCPDNDTKSTFLNKELYLATESEDADKLKFLIRHGANPGMTRSYGRTCLLRKVSPKIMEILLIHPEARKIINYKSHYGFTALNTQVANCDPEIVKMLIEAGADVNIGDPKPLDKIKEMLIAEPENTERYSRLLKIQKTLGEALPNKRISKEVKSFTGI